MAKKMNTGLRASTSRLVISAGLSAISLVGIAGAQDLPPGSDPARINEELRRRQEQLRETQPVTERGEVTNAQSFEFDPLKDTGVSFVLNEVQFESSAFLTQAQLDGIAAEYTGREVTFTDLNEMVAKVNALYDAGGYLTARAVLAPQRIEGGVVKVTLVEGVVEDMSVTGNTYYGAEYVAGRLFVPSGTVVDLPELEKELLRFNRLNNAKVMADIKPGGAFGTTDITLIMQEPDRNQLDLFVDNNGFESTGEFEGGAIGRRYRLFRDDDQLSGFIVGAGGSVSGSVSYSMPLGKRGMRGGLSYVRGQTEVINGPFKDLSVEGTSDTIAATASMPLLFRQGRFVGADLTISRTAAETTVDGIQTSDTEIIQAEAGLSADFVTEKNVIVLRTSGLMASAEEQLFDDTRDISLLRGAALFSRSITPKTRGSVDLQWQYAFEDDLPGTLEFQLGGANSIRAFDPGTVAGDSGYFAKVQLDREVHRGEQYALDIFGFYDMGEVQSLFPTVNLSAAGLGARLSRGQRINLSGSVGVPIEDGDLPEQSDVRAFVTLSVKAY
ncbi:ShlB/FhaC/HecB family hemolysin secretion/activation protein [Parvularcula marina]|uniref:ShlB/FhaC/HecB family hemolysin secretion/activation protein n=1 Tax=Parvularcula marina TaxID=2292771 RepID=A0A371RKY8_9PROT|nr:ShlB/FhaC/HecB family hemolysin secretion/activation protein [Parvularcula marina]RFB06132.1 ShlB/FhaC/HecB family hemolysin secretion/activation protein [Parvularcula marina]